MNIQVYSREPIRL